MKSLIKLLIISCLIAFSCSGVKEKQFVDILKTKLSALTPDSTYVLEAILPSVPELHWFRNWIVVINSFPESDLAPLTFINSETMKVEFTIGAFGRGPGEFTSVDPYYFEKTDTSIAILTNAFNETIYAFDLPNNFSLLSRTPVTFEPLNNLTKISDTIFTFRNDDRDSCNYVVFNTTRQKRVNRFREQPDIGKGNLSFSDCRRFFSSWVIINDEKTSIADFYVYNPVIHFYDQTYNLRTAIWTETSAGCTFGEDIRAGSCTEYFDSPKKAAGLIWVKYINKSKKETQPFTELQVWNWDGKLIKRYDLNKNKFNYIVSDDGKSLYVLSRSSEKDMIEKYNLK
jgi:hypothetical protein